MAVAQPATASSPISIRGKRRSRRRTLSSSSSAKSTFPAMYEMNGGNPLGRGAYGSVYKCIHRVTEIEYAVKIISKAGPCPKKVYREIEVYYQCQESDNILHLVELFEDENNFFLVFELVQGGSLANRLEKSESGVMNENSVRHLVSSISKALFFLHNKGIAHRDIKPDNILLPFDNSLEGAKLCDFDLASRAHARQEFRGDLCMTSPVGSAEFMAPEVVRAFTASEYEQVIYDQSCDIWSLGVIAYTLLSGRAPFIGCCGKDCGWEEGGACDDCMDLLFLSIEKGNLKFPKKNWNGVSERAIQLISRCLAKDPKMRPRPEEILDSDWLTNQSSFPNETFLDNLEVHA